jgi:hypothetical protein
MEDLHDHSLSDSLLESEEMKPSSQLLSPAVGDR